jgi:ferredoxin
VCGWTGYVMVWDVQGQVLAVEGARLLDRLPILSEPVSRMFMGERPVPSAFFFMNLFLHAALPLGMGVVLWLHVGRLARPRLLPPSVLGWWTVVALTVLAVLWPVAMAPPADLFARPGPAPYDVFFSFWLPVAAVLPPVVVWAGITLGVAVLVAVPYLTRPRRSETPAPAVVDERLCTGCEQCALDCPFLAISMVDRVDGREGRVARVDADLCVACGICSGSCAPMVVGPPGRTGRDQLAEARRFTAARAPAGDEVVVIACRRGAGGIAALERIDGSRVVGVDCVGSLHTSVIEHLVRSGAGGVLVMSCPKYDCTGREGVEWLEARMYHEREADLKARVDRRRVRWVEAGAAERGLALHEIRAFRDELVAGASGELEELDLLALCERGEGEGG